MPEKRKTLPSVLLIILSALGIFISALIIGLSVISLFILPPIDQNTDISNGFLTESIIVLATLICAINLYTLITATKLLQYKHIRKLFSPKRSILVLALIIWVITLVFGHYVSQRENLHTLLALLTIISVTIPIWILVHLARIGLPRSTALREHGALTIGLTVATPLILIVEIIFLVMAVITVMAALGLQNNIASQLPLFLENLSGPESIIEFENSLFALIQEPIVAAGIFITLGVVAPLIEELFKPMAIWFLLNRPLMEHEGYAVGLISGGAFALLESAGMIIQISPVDWLSSVSLRAATSVLHIGLSGLVGYGLARSWTREKRWNSILYILSAAAIHGAWNSIALYAGFTAMPITENISDAAFIRGSIITFGLMSVIFIGVIIVNYFINRSLRRDITSSVIISPEAN